MGVLVAGNAGIKSQAGVLHVRLRGRCGVTPLAPNLLMQASQRVTALAVVEALRRLPCFKRMATFAVGAELPAMLVLMAGEASLGKAQEGSVRILDLKGAEILLRDKLFLVALLTSQRGVLSLQKISALAVIKGITSSRPRHNAEGASQMLRVTPHTILPLIRLGDNAGVVSALRRQALLNFLVAIQTFELRPAAAQPVARSTLGE
jgi:hypothetical protein